MFWRNTRLYGLCWPIGTHPLGLLSKARLENVGMVLDLHMDCWSEGPKDVFLLDSTIVLHTSKLSKRVELTAQHRQQ
jgi:hypothetical protein